jgi:hypothetical protein
VPDVTGTFTEGGAGPLARSAPHGPFRRAALIGVAVLLFSGCNDPSPQNPPPPCVPVPEDVLADVVGYFETNKKLKFAKLQTDRHKGFFVRRRAQILGCANPVWVTESGHTSLKTRIDNEYTQLDAFLTAKAMALTTAAGDPTLPAHLDLNDLAKPTNTTSASVVASNAATANRRRAYRARGIGWRAAAIHDNLWQASPGATSATLRQDAMSGIIDRRIRLIERMNYTISNATALGGPWSFAGGGPTGPWKDGFRVRMFEYPRIPAIVVSQVVGFVGAANIASETDPSYQAGKPWKWEPGHHRLYYNVPPWPGNRFPDNEKNDWTMDSPNYKQQLTPSSTAAAAIDTLFTPNPDWWGRAWLFCDQVLSALHIEALLFGLRRLVQPASDATFNAIVTGHPAGYVALGAFVDGTPGSGGPHLMHDPADQYFENLSINEGDLQLGDHLIFWNSFVYAEISAGEWRLENSVVIDVDSDPATGGISRDKLHLQGHGTSERDYATYQRVDIAGQLNRSLDLARSAVAAAAPGATSLDWNGHAGLLVKWEPYEAFNPPGAWWVQMNLATPMGTRWATISDALQAVQGSIATDPAPGPGYKPPPSSTAVFFPLYRPAVAGGWAGYLAARRANAAYRAPKNLVAFNADGSIMPGLHYAGQGKPFPIVRPKVQP